MKVEEFLSRTFDVSNEFNVRPRAVCKDGYSISIQGGTPGHYCEPRYHCDNYSQLELGYPSILDDELKEYAEEKDTDSTIFAYVPINIIETVIEKHGGITGMFLPIPKKGNYDKNILNKICG